MRQRIEIVGRLDRRAVEALQLEILHLVRRFGVDLTGLQIERVSAEEQNGST